MIRPFLIVNLNHKQEKGLFHSSQFLLIRISVANLQINQSIYFSGCIQISDQVDTMDKMKTVKDKIFKNYDKSIRPTNGTNTTEVYTAFWPRQILDFVSIFYAFHLNFDSLMKHL